MTEAGSLRGLAEGLADRGVPVARFVETVEEVNAVAASGRWADLHPARERHRYGLTEPPFFAVAVKAAITYTTGGVAVDDELRVLHRAASTSPLATLVTNPDEVGRTPVPGLFCAGADVGGMSRDGYLGGLLPAVTTGRWAGRGAAGHARA